ncbi:unnamed protein product [Rhizophagus irregularis]|nr:unnamed protein product [Rhizophagus irregularis]CAB4430805.1 unnamed protein product [Rhizophagus irregularis]
MAILVTSDEVHNRIESGGEYSTYQSSIVNNDHTQDHASDIQSKDTPLSKSYTLFSEIQLLKQEDCMKEEAMVIALERYLIPKILKDQETSYSSAFIRICTSLTKDCRIYDLDTPSTSQGMQLETYRSGIKITSPVNKNISIAAIITTVYMVDFEDCNPGSD